VCWSAPFEAGFVERQRVMIDYLSSATFVLDFYRVQLPDHQEKHDGARAASSYAQ
jgi:hypothetical protein